MIFFLQLKEKKKDGNKFVKQSFKNKASLAVVSKVQKNLNLKRQIIVRDTLKFLTDSSKIFRNNLNSKIIAITGSCGKTTLKELLGNSMKKISTIFYSPKSFNNKFGVPLSILNLDQNKKFGIFEVGMDKKGEINFLSKILKPNLGIITNISYAHSKNFKNIKGIAEAKSEIIQNIKNRGNIVLNKDDQFYKFLELKSLKKNLKIF